MIFIDLGHFVPDDDWLYQAWLLTAALKGKATKAERALFIHENKDFWGTLKRVLPFNDKCWFSEAKESVSVYEIEHFRPTNATSRTKKILKTLKTFKEAQRSDWVKENKYKGGGYWWLAFEYTNYRNTGKRINQIKSTRFPLRQVSFVAYKENDDCALEQPILLDPVKPGDAELLTFDPDGKARPTVADESSFNYLRAMTSIEIYGLNDIERLVIHRAEKWNTCFTAIRRAEKKYRLLSQAAANNDLAAFNENFSEFDDFIKLDILPAIDAASEFSSVAKACVMSYAGYEWVNDYVLNP